jgi:hypothetical protein
MTVNVETKPTLLDRIRSGEVHASEIKNYLVVDMSRFKVKHQSLLTKVQTQEANAMSELLAVVCDVPPEVIEELPVVDFIPLATQIGEAIQSAVGVSRTGKN